jgi:(1->4)-alpha-D-glucan 1-alpha-D-glucosylmutase
MMTTSLPATLVEEQALLPAELLNQLASLLGIQTGFTDAFGTQCQTPPLALAKLIGLVLHLENPPETEVDWQHLLTQQQTQLAEKAVPAYWVLKTYEALPLPTAQPLKINRTSAFSVGLESSVTLNWQLQIQPTDELITGQWVLPCSPETTHWEVSLPPEIDVPFGYHQLKISTPQKAVLGQVLILSTPATCYIPPALQAEGQTTCGVAAQLYSLQTETTWGIGDFGALQETLTWANQNNVGAVGINPIHELFPHNLQEFSPYAPSSRPFLNALYVSLPSLPEFELPSVQAWFKKEAIQQAIETLQAEELVDYVGVGKLKNEGLWQCYQAFLATEWAINTPRAKAFTAYCEAEGDDLFRLAQYQAIAQYFASQSPEAWGWCVWEEAFKNPHSAEVTALTLQLTEEIRFYQYRQWVAHTQLQGLHSYCKQQQLPIGLYLDLAVGASLGSADIWANQSLYVTNASVGCPPDAFNQLGQNWGLPPMHPSVLVEQQFQPFVTLVRSIMKYAGAVRIDHALALFQAFWIPTGETGQMGAYVSYPTEALLAILAIESHTYGCLVIGEDLGTVPEWIKQTLNSWHILSYRIMGFERQSNGEYLPPAQYPSMALVTASTHDLPTVQGFWQGADITLRSELALFPTVEAEQQEHEARPYERQRLLNALIHNGLMPAGFSHNQADYPLDKPLPTLVYEAVQRFLQATPAKLHLVALEDGLGLTTQLNMPGTTTQHPNWRRKLGFPLQEALDASMAWRN